MAYRMPIKLGVDLGGTKIEAVALDESNAERFRKRVPTPQGDYEGTLRAIAGLVADADRAVGAGDGVGVGVGTPGALSPATGLLKNSNSTVLIGKPLDKDLAALLRRPVRLANDANCFALSEAKDGAAKGSRVVFGAILGTGVGGGIVVNGHLLTGANAIAGEWGHNPLPWPKDDERPGPACYCGRRGCIESFVSGPGLTADFDAKTPAEEIAARAARGDADADRALSRYEERLARALANLINILDPDAIVLGGGMSNVERLYRNVPRLWSPWVFSDHVATKLVRARHGDSSGVRGAAWLFDA